MFAALDISIMDVKKKITKKSLQNNFLDRCLLMSCLVILRSDCDKHLGNYCKAPAYLDGSIRLEILKIVSFPLNLLVCISNG